MKSRELLSIFTFFVIPETTEFRCRTCGNMEKRKVDKTFVKNAGKKAIELEEQHG